MTAPLISLAFTLPDDSMKKNMVATLRRIGSEQAGPLRTETGETWHPANLLLQAVSLLEKLANVDWPAIAKVCEERDRLVSFVRNFVDANNHGPATEWTKRMEACHRQAETLLRELAIVPDSRRSSPPGAECHAAGTREGREVVILLRPWCWIFGHKRGELITTDSLLNPLPYRLFACPRCSSITALLLTGDPNKLPCRTGHGKDR